MQLEVASSLDVSLSISLPFVLSHRTLTAAFKPHRHTLHEMDAKSMQADVKMTPCQQVCLATEFYSGFLGSCSSYNHNPEERASLFAHLECIGALRRLQRALHLANCGHRLHCSRSLSKLLTTFTSVRRCSVKRGHRTTRLSSIFNVELHPRVGHRSPYAQRNLVAEKLLALCLTERY